LLNLFGKWKDQATQYVDVRVQLMKLKFVGGASSVLGSLILGLMLMFVSMLALIFFGMGVMECFSTWLESRIGGAFATAGVFVILLLVLYGMRKSISLVFANIFVRIMTSHDDDDDDDDDDKPGQRKKENTDEEL